MIRTTIIMYCVALLAWGCSGGSDGKAKQEEIPEMVCWEKIVGGEQTYGAAAIQQTADGGYVTAGNTDLWGQGHAKSWVTKMMSDGSTLWEWTSHETATSAAVSVEETPDLGYIVLSNMYYDYSDEQDVWLVKLNHDGEFEWDKTFGGERNDVVRSLLQTSDGGYVLAGYKCPQGSDHEDIWVFKVDANAEMEWEMTYNIDRFDGANSIAETLDAGYIIAGHFDGEDDSSGDGVIIKIDGQGNREWEMELSPDYLGDTDGSATGFPLSIQQTADGGHILAGRLGSAGLVLKLDENGDFEWKQAFEREGSLAKCVAVQQTADLGYVVAGNLRATDSYFEGEGWLLKLDPEGQLLWEKVFAGSVEGRSSLYAVQQTTDMGYIVSGWVEGSAWILKLNASGDVDCQQATASCPKERNCYGQECGADPVCGESCGTCDSDETCQNGKCTSADRENTISPPNGTCLPDCGEETSIPAGGFMMGCNEDVDDDCESHEYPYHEVYLDAYYIDVTEVTQGAFQECVNAGVCDTPVCDWNPNNTPDRPVACVNWYSAKTYCKYAGKRLPTEAEWEKAARGTDGRKYPWGNEPPSCKYAVMDDNDGVGGCGTNAGWDVCSKEAGNSPYGVCDMAGNVWEWVADWYDSEYYENSPGSNPKGPNGGSTRVIRGGGLHNDFSHRHRVSDRSHFDPLLDYDVIGFRCARSE